MLDIKPPRLINLPVGKVTGSWEVYLRELFDLDKRKEIFWMGNCKIQINNA